MIAAEKEATATTRCLQAEKEETECGIEEEKQEAETARSLKKSAGKRCLEHFKRELERLELKKLNAARARLKVYEENEFYSDRLQNSKLPTVAQAINQVNPMYQHRQSPKDVASPKKCVSR